MLALVLFVCKMVRHVFSQTSILSNVSLTKYVEEFKIYDSVDSVFYGSSGRGHAYRIFIFRTGKFEFRLSSNISAAEQATAEKIAVQKFTIEFYA